MIEFFGTRSAQLTGHVNNFTIHNWHFGLQCSLVWNSIGT